MFLNRVSRIHDARCCRHKWIYSWLIQNKCHPRCWIAWEREKREREKGESAKNLIFLSCEFAYLRWMSKQDWKWRKMSIAAQKKMRGGGVSWYTGMCIGKHQRRWRRVFSFRLTLSLIRSIYSDWKFKATYFLSFCILWWVYMNMASRKKSLSYCGRSALAKSTQFSAFRPTKIFVIARNTEF